jgi:hypothetical protein
MPHLPDDLVLKDGHIFVPARGRKEEHETEPHVAEALAYSLLLTGDATAAKEMLDMQRRSRSKTPSDRVRIRKNYGIDYHHTLAEIIRVNSDATVGPDVFKAPGS